MCPPPPPHRVSHWILCSTLTTYTHTTWICHTRACAHTEARASDRVINNKESTKLCDKLAGSCTCGPSSWCTKGLNLSRDGRRHTCHPRRRTSVIVARPQLASFEQSAISFYFMMTQAGIRLARTTPFSSIVDLSWHDVTAPACWMFWSNNGLCSGSMCSVN
jgi:hypothetical protein